MDSAGHLVAEVAAESAECPRAAGLLVPVHLWGWPTFWRSGLDGGAIAG